MDNNSEHTENPDATLEILMSDLDPETMLQFTKARYPEDDLMTQVVILLALLIVVVDVDRHIRLLSSQGIGLCAKHKGPTG